jgi:hypothetical protein
LADPSSGAPTGSRIDATLSLVERLRAFMDRSAHIAQFALPEVEPPRRATPGPIV